MYLSYEEEFLNSERFALFLKNMEYMIEFLYKSFCNKYTPVCLLVLSLAVSFVCYWMQGNLWLSITQIVVGLVLGFQSVLESKRVHREMTKLTKRMDETGAKVVENPEYLFLLIDSVEILFSINKEGCVDWQKGISKPIKLELDTIKRYIANIKMNMSANDK